MAAACDESAAIEGIPCENNTNSYLDSSLTNPTENTIDASEDPTVAILHQAIKLLVRSRKALKIIKQVKHLFRLFVLSSNFS